MLKDGLDLLENFLNNSLIQASSRKGFSFDVNRGHSYSKRVFGSKVGPCYSLLDAGIHDLCHCIDYIMQGKITRIGLHGLDFPIKSAVYYEEFNVTDYEPKTTQITDCECRVFALQAFLYKEYGTFLKSEYLGNALDKDRGYNVYESSLEEFERTFLNTCESGYYQWPDVYVIPMEEGGDRNATFLAYCQTKFREYYNSFSVSDIKTALDRLDRIMLRYSKVKIND